MIGRANSNISIGARSDFGTTAGGSITFGDTANETKYAETATEHLCQAIALDDNLAEPARKILAEVKGVCR